MKYRMLIALILIFFTPITISAQEVGASQGVDSFPECTRPCFVQEAEKMCGTGRSASCICSNEDFAADMAHCLRGKCPVDTIFASLRSLDEMCHRPRRDRRMEAWPYISIHIFCILCAIIRFYTKMFIIRKFSPEDWLALVYFAIYIVYFGIGHHALMSAFGQDIWWIEPDDLAHALKLFWVDIPFYSLLLGLTKISIILFYIRLCHVYEQFCRICWACVIAIGLNTAVFIFLPIFQCTPIRWNWDRFRGHEVDFECLNVNTIQWAMNITSIVFDVVVLALPIPLVLKMRSTWRRKAAIIFMFSLGVVVLVASCLKMRYNILYGNSTNITWDYLDLMVWAGIESSVSVAAPCLPTVRLFLHRMFPKLFGRIFAFGSQGETTLEEYIKAEEDEVARWSGDVEKIPQGALPIKRPRRVLSAEGGDHIHGADGEPPKRKTTGITEASKILKSLDDMS
ncbi:hypothetical protein B0I35DRAFT_481439 [Stachybotrys elegans]|uniref:CFEM domain-containing protein n=1 Tax=Stachybotrys elegans TaxID=80388 RepID=A0A8K0SJQ5_9HYPO|nr:hypothetical protein B0I35DRAFT_481439 [Stachybotrys elegans]